jgi:signal transduction histidine kinase
MREAALVTVEGQARELRSLDEAKSRFFANVSHELRTLLTLVQGPLQDVLDNRFGPTSDAVREQVSTVLASGKRLGELVEQLLDVARLQSGEFRLHIRRHDLKPLFERLAHSFDALAGSRGIGFKATLPTATIPAHVDADQIEKVYSNLLSNAFKFTPPGRRVVVTVEARGGPDERDTVETAGDDETELVVTVEDNGPGIPVAEQERIFERFHQVDDSSKRSHGGAGLGLALVKEVAELHGGTVELWSEPGVGSRFTVRIPVAGPDRTAVLDHATERSVPADVPRLALREHLAGGYVESGEQSGRTITDVIVGDSLNVSETQGQERLRALERLHLALLIAA